MPGPHLGNCQLGGNNANAYACQRADTITIGRICKQGETLPFIIIWPLVGIQGRLRFSKSNVLLLSPAFCNFSNDTLTRTIKSVEIWRSRRFRWNPFKSCGTERSAENNNWASFVSSFLWCRELSRINHSCNVLNVSKREQLCFIETSVWIVNIFAASHFNVLPTCSENVDDFLKFLPSLETILGSSVNRRRN